MIIFWLLIIPILYVIIKLILYLIIRKYGKFSYDGFSAAGFAYDSEKDIFYSTMNAWQKNFGYTHKYDVLAPIFRMIIDTEPVRFYYNNKNWLITFWKGQYGIVTGAEVGIYCTSEKKINKNTIYFPANSKEMLDIGLTLYKKEKIITKIKTKHWWLAVFKLGMFSKPKDLLMDISITFPNKQMLEAFLKSFKKLHHSRKTFKVVNNTFYFKYKKPHTRKVWTRSWFTDFIRQSFNHKNVQLYNKYFYGLIDDNKIDDSKAKNNNLIMVNKFIPSILKNSKEKEIKEESFNDRKKNIIFLDSRVYSEIKVDENEQ